MATFHPSCTAEFVAVVDGHWMLVAGMGAWVARYGLFSLGADDSIVWMVILGVVLHGICYDFFFVTGMIYVDKKAPTAIRHQAQGVLVLITQGLGLGIGAKLFFAHVVMNTSEAGDVDWHTVWLYPALFALWQGGCLCEQVRIVALARKPLSREEFLALVREWFDEHSETGPAEPAVWEQAPVWADFPA